MNLLLKEYLVSGVLSEAEHCLRDLEVPHFHHELVYEVWMNISHTKIVSSLSYMTIYKNDYIQLCSKVDIPIAESSKCKL